MHTNAGLNSVIFNIEGWYRYTFGGNFYLEPQIELITGYIGEINIKNLDILLSMKDSIPISSKIAIFTGKQFNISNHKNIIDSLSFRVGFGYAYDLKSYGDRILKDSTLERKYNGVKDDRLFINLSTSYAIGNNHRLNIEFERSFLGQININWLVNASYRISF